MGKTKSNSANKLHKLLKTCVSSGVMAWAMMAGGTALAGPDACTVSGMTAICEGDQSTGVSYTSGITDLTVQNLTGDISTSGTHGIFLYNSAAPVVLNSNTGAFAIRTSGSSSHGIYASSDVGAITVNHSGDIATTGPYSNGITVRGGSDATNSSPFTINVASGHISTTGDYSRGFFMVANSDAVGNINNAGSVSTTGDYSAGIEIGAGAGLNLISNGDVSTTGLRSDAIVAMTLGGESVVTNSGALSTLGQRSNGINAWVRDGNLTLTNNGDITTVGGEAKAIYGEVVTGNATIVNSGILTTSGIGSYGVQSSSQRGDISFTHTGSIATSGDYGHGAIFGLTRGNLTLDVQGDVSTTGSEASALYLADYNGLLSGTISGSLSTTGAASYGIRAEGVGTTTDLELATGGSITTSADNADGIWFNLSNSGAENLSTLTVNGQIQTSGATAHGVRSRLSDLSANTVVGGDINTTGTNSYGAYIDVIRGNADFTMTGTGTIVARGGYANGIYQRTTGNFSNTVTIGESNAVTTSSGNGHAVTQTAEGSVNFTNNGSVRANGNSSHGLYIVNSTDTSITNTGILQGGSGTAWAIAASGAGDTTLVNRGTISALSSNGIQLGAGDDTISNFGRIEGEVDMGGGLNAFTNEDGGVLVLWDDFILNGATPVGSSDTKVAVAGELSNNGLLYVYGDGLIGTSTITGDLFQSTLGTLVFDADAASFTTDYLIVTGNADLSGTIRLNLQNVPVNLADAPDFPTDLFSYSIIRAGSLSMADGLIFDPAELTIENTVAYTFALRAENGAIIVDVIEMTSNFEDMLDTLATDYQTGFALYLDRQQQAPDTTGIQTLVDALRNLPDATALQASFNTFAPYSVIAQDRLLRDDARSLLSRAPGCNPGAGVEFCLTGGVDYGEASGDFTAFSDEYEADRTGLSFGIGLNVAENWQAGAEVRVSADDLRLPGDATADQDSYVLAGGVTGTVFNGLQLGVSGLIGNASADVSRGSLLSTAQRLTSDQETRVQGVSARVAYPVAAGDWTITPGLQASNVCIDGDAFSEAGGLADAISVDAHDSCLSAFGPQLSVQTPAFELGGFQATGFAQLGYEALNDEDIVVSAALNAAGLPDDRFQTRFAGDGDARTSVMFGLQGQNEAGWTIRAGAGLSETDTQSIWSAGLSFARAL